MGASGDLNNVYNNIGQNTGNEILIALDVQTGDTEYDVLRMYRLIGKEEAEFPIVMIEGGSKLVTKLVSPSTPSSRGPTKLVHPDLEVEKVEDYHEAELTAAFNSTNNDDCDPGVSILNSADNNNMNSISAFNIVNATSYEFDFQVQDAGIYDIEFYTSSGRMVYQIEERSYSIGMNTTPLNGLSQGLYFVRFNSLNNTSVQKVQIQ